MEPRLLIHELTHALDQKNGWNLGFFYFVGDRLLKAEQLASSSEHVFNCLSGFEEFEDGLRKPYWDAKVVQDHWYNTWMALRSMNVHVFVNGSDRGLITNDNLLDLARKTGLRLSYAALAPVYQQLVDNKYGKGKIILQKPANLPSAFD